MGNWELNFKKCQNPFLSRQWYSGLFKNFISYLSTVVYSCPFSHVFEEMIGYPTIKFVWGVEFQPWIYVIPKHIAEEVKYIFHACHILVV